MGRTGLWMFVWLTVAFMAGEWWFERFALFELPDVKPTLLRNMRIALIHIMAVCYLPVAWGWVVRGTRHITTRLKHRLSLAPAEFADFKGQIGSYSLVGVIVGCVAVNLLFAMLTYATTPEANPWSVEVVTVEVFWHRVVTPFMAAFFYLFIHAVIAESRRLNELARSLKEPDLMDLGYVGEFGQIALRHSLLILGFAAIASLFLLEDGFEEILAVGWVLLASIAALALVAPVSGIRGRMIAAKRRELKWCAERIEKARDALKAGAEQTQLTSLLVYKGTIESISDWPFNRSAMAKFAAFLLLPIGSWIGGAMVERLVELLIG